MKKRGWILATLLILFALFLFFYIRSGTKKSEKKLVSPPALVVYPVLFRDTLVFEGELVYSRFAKVSFPMAGLLEEGIRNYKIGDRFVKGEILFQLNNTEAFAELSAKKLAFAASLKNNIPFMQPPMAGEKDKWRRYAESIKTDDLLPELPYFASPAEKQFFVNRYLMKEFLEVDSLENALRQYYFAAPFDGVFTEIYLKPGAKPKKGQAIAKLAALPANEIRTKATNLDFKWELEKLDTLIFIDENGNKMRATFHHLEPLSFYSSSIYSNAAFFRIGKTNKSLKPGTKFYATHLRYFSEPVCAIPHSAAFENRVTTVHNGQYRNKTVKALKQTEESLYVSGLEAGDSVLVHFPKTSLKK